MVLKSRYGCIGYSEVYEYENSRIWKKWIFLSEKVSSSSNCKLDCEQSAWC